MGLKPANPFGLYDMHGNVCEWCGDWMDDQWYSASPTNDPQGPPSRGFHAVRGGGWSDPASYLHSAYRRLIFIPMYRSNIVGFRVVRGG